MFERAVKDKKMTRKDYVAVAKILNGLVNSIEAHTTESKAIDKAVENFCELFATDNSRFDSLRFVEAVYKAQ